jgi:dipeptidyl aminopeptidase/acylaminoacyl peptidase
MGARVAIWRFFALLSIFFLVPPLLAQAVPPPLSAYGDLPSIEEVVISPTGKKLAVLGSFNERRMLVVFDQELKMEKSFVLGEVKVRSFDFVNDGLLLLRRSTTEDLGFGFTQDKFEFYQAFLVPINDSDARLIFGNRRNLVDATFGFYGIRNIEGRPTGFFGAIELEKSASGRSHYAFKHGRPTLYAVDLLSNKARRVAPAAPENGNRDWLIGKRGEVLARLDTSRSSGKWEIRGTDSVIAEGQSEFGRIYLVSIGRDGSTIIYGTRDDNSGETAWYEVPVDGSRQPTEVFADIAVERIFTSRETGELIGYLRDDEQLEPVFFDPENTDKAKKIRAAFADFNNRMVDWTPGFGHVVVRIDGNGDSGSYFKVDLSKLKADPIGWERPLIGPESVGPVSRVDYTAADGLEMDGILTLPVGREAKNLPVVMLPHGGPHSQDDEGFDWWAQAFASRGYAVFQPNFRGSTNRGEKFIQAGYGEWGRKMQTDISDGLAMLAEKDIIDPERACIVGASYGGYAALAGVTLQQGLYRCAVSVAGVADVSLMSRLENRESDSKVRARSLAQQLGPRSRYKDISPRYHADKADAPILLIHGRDDTVVHYEQSLKMADALKDAGKPYEFVELEGEDHWLSLGETRKAMLKATMDFVLRHNPPD